MTGTHRVPHLGRSHTCCAHADAILKFLILSEPWPPPFHFALGPASYVAHRALDRIFYFLFSPFLASTYVLGTMLRPKPCQEKEKSLGDGSLDPSFDSQPKPLRLGVCVFFWSAPATVTPQHGQWSPNITVWTHHLLLDPVWLPCLFLLPSCTFKQSITILANLGIR